MLQNIFQKTVLEMYVLKIVKKLKKKRGETSFGVDG